MKLKNTEQGNNRLTRMVMKKFFQKAGYLVVKTGQYLCIFHCETNYCVSAVKVSTVFGVSTGLQIFLQDWWAEVTHGAKNGGSFSEMMGPSISNQPQLTFGSILYVYTDTDTCMNICILTADDTVKPVFSGHSKKKTKIGFQD